MHNCIIKVNRYKTGFPPNVLLLDLDKDQREEGRGVVVEEGRVVQRGAAETRVKWREMRQSNKLCNQRKALALYVG